MFVLDALSNGCNVINNNLVKLDLFKKNKFIILKKDINKNIFLIDKAFNNFQFKSHNKITTKKYLDLKKDIKNYLNKIK